MPSLQILAGPDKQAQRVQLDCGYTVPSGGWQ